MKTQFDIIQKNPDYHLVINQYDDVTYTLYRNIWFFGLIIWRDMIVRTHHFPLIWIKFKEDRIRGMKK